MEGDISTIQIAFTGRGDLTTNVQVIVEIDSVALEPDENFTLRFTVTSTSPANLLTGSNVFIVNELEVFIRDRTGE